jgi:hypothetical protein
MRHCTVMKRSLDEQLFCIRQYHRFCDFNMRAHQQIHTTYHRFGESVLFEYDSPRLNVYMYVCMYVCMYVWLIMAVPTCMYVCCQCAYTTKPRDPYSAIRIAWLSGISTLTYVFTCVKSCAVRKETRPVLNFLYL